MSDKPEMPEVSKKPDQVKLNKKYLLKQVKKIETKAQRHTRRFVFRRAENAKLVAKDITIWLVLIALVVLGSGLQSLLSKQFYTTSAGASGGTYTEGVIGDISTLNPLYASTTAESSIARLVFSSLYNYDEHGKLSGDLATNISVDESMKVYTVKVRSDAKWHDGEPLTVDDIIYTLKLIKNPATGSSLRFAWSDVEVAKIQKDEIRFTLPAQYSAFTHALNFPILPKHLLEDIAPGAIRENPFSQSPVGSGPFKFKLLQQSDALSQHKVAHLSSNDSYFRGAPKLSRLELHAYNSNADMLRAIKSGELSGANSLSPTSLKELNLDSMKYTPLAKFSGLYLIFNLKNETAKDRALRKALQVGTNTDKIRRAIGGGQSKLDLPILNSQVWGDDVPSAPVYNIDSAKKMLEDEGWKKVSSHREKAGKKLEITLTTTKDDEYEAVAREVQSQWQQLGVIVNKKVYDNSSPTASFAQEVLQARDFEVVLTELLIGADPDVYSYWHSSQSGQGGLNFSGYSNQIADINLVSARSRSEPELRNIKYKQFARQWLEDVPAIAVYQPAIEYVSNRKVSSVNEGDQVVTSADRYTGVLHWTVTNREVFKTP